MNRFSVSLKTRVRYEGLVRTLDRRSNLADLEKLPDHVWFVIGQVLRSKFRKPILTRRSKTVHAVAKKPILASAQAVAPVKVEVEVVATV